MGAAEKLDIVGKDWLTVDEAMHYCGVSRSQFDSNIDDYGIESRNFMGKKLYEKAAPTLQSTAPSNGQGHNLLTRWRCVPQLAGRRQAKPCRHWSRQPREAEGI